MDVDLGSDPGRDSFAAAAGTLASYLLVIGAMALLLFGVPYLIFLLL